MQARDEYNGTIEGNFTVQLEDMPDLVYDPSTLDSKLEEFRDEGKSDVLVVDHLVRFQYFLFPSHSE